MNIKSMSTPPYFHSYTMLLTMLFATNQAFAGTETFSIAATGDNNFITITNGHPSLLPLSDDQRKTDSVFRVVPGLADLKHISIESVSHPQHFLVHTKGSNSVIVLRRKERNRNYQIRATFKLEQGLNSYARTSFQSFDRKKYYIAVRQEELILERRDHLYNKDATFRLTEPKNFDSASKVDTCNGRVVSLQSLSAYNFFVRHKNGIGYVSGIPSNDLDRKDATFRIVPGLSNKDLFSIESVNFPHHYLRQHDLAIKLHKNDNSKDFAIDSTFRMVPGLANVSWLSFESVRTPGHYIRHRDRKLTIETNTDELFRRSATFRLTAPQSPK